MRRRWMGLTAISVGAMAALAWAAEVKLPIDQVPAAPRATILAEKGEIEDIAKQTSQNGKVIYEADIVVKGKLIELRVTDDGKVVSRKIEGDVIPATKPAPKDPEAVAEAKICQVGAENLAKAKITLQQAITAAQKQSETAKPIRAELKKSDTKRIFQITLLDGETYKSINIDAASGEVAKEASAAEQKKPAKAQEDVKKQEAQAKPQADVVKALPVAKVTLAQAIETAVAENPKSKAFFAVFKPEDGQPRYEILVISADKGIEVVVDGITRKVLEQETKADNLGKSAAFHSKFKVAKENFSSTGKNPYFSLEPGTVSVFQDGKVKLTITVTDKTKVVDGVETRVVEEREEEDGKPVEISQNFFAISKKTGNVYYFGEEVDEYEGGNVTHGGAWQAGVAGAKFGLMMPAKAKVGHKFYQEQAPKVAMDRAEIVGLDEEVKTPAGTFKCVHVKETSAIEKGVSHKYYAPEVGLVKDDGAVLVKAPTVK